MPKRILLIASIAIMAFCAMHAQDQAQASQPNIVENINEADGSVFVQQPHSLDAITTHISGAAMHSQSHTVKNYGYRVQIFADNNVRTSKANAESRKRLIQQRMPDTQAYITFESPYWRVRVGDYSTYSEADAAMREIKNAFPEFANDLRIVRERINIER